MFGMSPPIGPMTPEDAMTFIKGLREGARKEETGLTAPQQTARLKEIYAQIFEAAPETFEPGEVVWRKLPALSPYKNPGPAIFLEMLEDPLEGAYFVQDAEELRDADAAATYDCRILVLSVRGLDAHWHVHFADTRELTREEPEAAGAVSSQAGEDDDAAEAVEPAA